MPGVLEARTTRLASTQEMNAANAATCRQIRPASPQNPAEANRPERHALTGAAFKRDLAIPLQTAAAKRSSVDWVCADTGARSATGRFAALAAEIQATSRSSAESFSAASAALTKSSAIVFPWDCCEGQGISGTVCRQYFYNLCFPEPDSQAFPEHIHRRLPVAGYRGKRLPRTSNPRGFACSLPRVGTSCRATWRRFAWGKRARTRV